MSKSMSKPSKEKGRYHDLLRRNRSIQFLKPSKSFCSSKGFTEAKRKSFAAWETPGPGAYVAKTSFTGSPTAPYKG